MPITQFCLKKVDANQNDSTGSLFHPSGDKKRQEKMVSGTCLWAEAFQLSGSQTDNFDTFLIAGHGAG